MKRFQQWQRALKKIVSYGGCSVGAALIETLIGWGLLHGMHCYILVANTVAILLGAIVHYFLTTAFVFKIKNSYESMIMYGITFVMGLALQNGVIWLFYEWLMRDQQAEGRYLISKVCSLGIPFLLIYWMRSKLSEKLKQKREESL